MSERPPPTLPDSPEGWIQRARALVTLLDAAGPRIDDDKALPAEILSALHEAQLFRLLLPRSVDGGELDLPSFFEVMLWLAQGDASVAWTVSQSAGCALAAAYMDADAAREVFGQPDAVLSWGFPADRCTMCAVKDGWMVTGRWAFGSGSRHSTYLGGHCQVVTEAGEPLRSSAGHAVERTALMPRTAVSIVDASWEVIGLRGTGSDTYAVQNLFVPARHCIVSRASGRDQQRAEGSSPEPEPERRESGTLYRFSPTAVFQTGFAAVALGLAQAMLKSLVELATHKTPSGTSMTLRDNAAVQERVATAHARLASCRAYMREALRSSWSQAQANGQHAFADRVDMRLASTFAIREASKVAEAVYREAGATAIFSANPFERRFRDIHAAAQQVQGQAAHLQTVGQYLLGIKPSTRFM